MHSLKIQNSKLRIRNYLSNPSGAVLLTVVVIIIIIGLTGVAIYSLTSTSTFTQLISQNTSKAYYLAESGFRVVASEYNNASDPKNNAFENLHATTLTLPDNSGAFDIRLYPYWFYTDGVYTANTSAVSLKIPGGTPLRDPSVTSSPRISLPGSGSLKLQGKTQLAPITLAPIPASPGDGTSFTYNIGAGFPYTIQADEEIFLAYSDINTVLQNIAQGGDMDLPGSSAIAQILPARNGSFRVYNENNDIMDYTYLEKEPAVVDPGNPPTTITLSGVDHQDANDESVFPFSIDGNSEIYFGRNLAVFTTATSGLGTTASTKTIGDYTDVGLDGGFSTGKDTISFEEDIADFASTMIDPTPGDTSDDPIVIDTVQKTIQLGRGLTNNYGSVWYKGDSDIANCIEGNCFLGRGIRAYLEFEFDDIDSSADSTDHGDGFSFALISSDTYTDGDTGEDGEYLGYAGAGAGPGLTGNGLQPPKMAVEIDTYPNSGAGDVCGGDSRRDDGDSNHTAMVYWGEETPGSFDATGGWISLGAQDWSSNTDNCDEVGARCGTLSFWFKRDAISYGGISSGDRLWGQSPDMEIRFSSDGADIILDWGNEDSLTIENHPFKINTWYFVAISWSTDRSGPGPGRIRFSYGDENNFYHKYAENNDWCSGACPTCPCPSWPPGVSENLFMNSGGGDGSQNFAVDGQGTDLRYYNEELDQADEIEGIWDNSRPTDPSSDPSLGSYHPLQSDELDAVTGVNASIIGSAGWSADTPSTFDCGASAATYDDNRHGSGGTDTPLNSLNTNSGNGNDGYHQVTKAPLDPNWLEDGLLHQLRFELVRPLALAEDGKVDTVYDYQIKVWIDCVGCTAGELAGIENVRSTFSRSPQIELTVQNGNSLELEQAVHDNLKRILFGFTQGTGSMTQNITLSNFELYFLRRYPVSNLATW